jgi:hypothetical protein
MRIPKASRIITRVEKLEKNITSNEANYGIKRQTKHKFGLKNRPEIVDTSGYYYCRRNLHEQYELKRRNAENILGCETIRWLPINIITQLIGRDDKGLLCPLPLYRMHIKGVSIGCD